jgi:excisionase family DNA binding protein
MKPTPKPLTLGDISRYCHVDRVTVQRWVKNGLIQAYRTPGGHYRASKGNFRRFLRQNNMPIFPEFFQDVPYRILLADQPEDELKTLVSHLEKADAGYEIKAGGSGREALILLGQFQPDLVVLNPQLDGLGGPSVCGEIKKMFPGGHFQILAVVGKGGNPEECLAAGADKSLKKPLEAGTFLSTVQEMMGAVAAAT